MIEKKENIDIMNQIRSWFSANNLIKNIPFFLLITALGILYIAKRGCSQAIELGVYDSKKSGDV